MTDHAVDLGVHQLLCNCRALLGISAIILCEQLKLCLLAADHHALGVQLVDCHLGAHFIVFAQVSNSATGGSHVTNLHHQVLSENRGGTASQCQDCRTHKHVQFQLHENLQL